MLVQYAEELQEELINSNAPQEHVGSSWLIYKKDNCNVINYMSTISPNFTKNIEVQ